MACFAMEADEMIIEVFENCRTFHYSIIFKLHTTHIDRNMFTYMADTNEHIRSITDLFHK